jgi:hypothetical protein
MNGHFKYQHCRLSSKKASLISISTATSIHECPLYIFLFSLLKGERKEGREREGEEGRKAAGRERERERD